MKDESTMRNSWLRRVGGRRLIAIMVLTTILLVALALITHAGVVPIVDDGGPDDEPGQKDLTYMTVDEKLLGDPLPLEITWQWDDTGWSGANSGDACAIFDTDGDGNVNYSLCAHVEGEPIVPVPSTLWICGDDKVDRCTNPRSVIVDSASSCTAYVGGIDPFSGDPAHVGTVCNGADCLTEDTVADCDVYLGEDFGDAVPKLLNVCSYPSGGPGSDPSDCVMVPEQGILTVIKEVVNDYGGLAVPGDFEIDLGDGVTAPFPGEDGGGTTFTLPTQTAYDVTEDMGDYAGMYAAVFSADCAGTIVTGDNKTCTIMNSDIAPTLTLVKHLPNDNGGTATQGQFQAYIDGNPVEWDTAVPLDAGPHTASEDEMTGYAASDWFNACAADGSVTLEPGDNLTCEITNNDIAPTLTLVKHLPNDNGGTATQGQFQAYIDGNPVEWDTAVPLDAGPHTASEDEMTGYAASDWFNACAADGSVTLEPGDNLTCEITNNDIAPTLTLVKHLPNDNGGTATQGQFQAYIDGNPVEWDTAVPLDAGPHTASEDEMTGYAASDWFNACAADGSVTLEPGDNLTCEITNNDIAPTLTLVKHLPNDNGGTATQGQFQAYIDGNPVEWDTAVPLDAGPHTASEDEMTGYAASDWFNACAADGSVTLEPGDNLTCEITNNDIAPTLTLVKHLPNDNGGTATQGQFQAYIDGNPVEWDTAVPLDAGPHTASEDEMTGYAASDWFNACAADGSVTLEPGDNLTCEITNNDIAPTLTLVKHLPNDNGGTATQGQFQAYIDGNPVEWDTAVPLDAGPHTASEDEMTGYAASDWFNACAADGSVTLEPGDNLTCEITNNDIAPKLTVVKVLLPSTETDTFTLYIDEGAIEVASVDDVGDGGQLGPEDLRVGDFTVGEDGYGGSDLADYIVEIGGDCDEYGDVSLALGDDKTCTITNTRYAAKAGYKWDDLTPNGQWDTAEPPIPGWSIELWDVTGTPDLVASTATDGNGYYGFYNLMPGKTYAVCELAWLGSFQTFPNASTPDPAGEQIFDCTTLGAGYGPYGYQFTAVPGGEYLDNDFGNTEQVGCTLTQGYWKTHSIYGPASHPDGGWYTVFGPYAPGAPGPDAPLFSSGLTWLEAFRTPPKKGNAWFILAHQWMAAYLNYYNGAGSGGTGVVLWLTDGAALLDAYDDYDGGDPLIPKDSPDRGEAVSLADLLDQYNNGYIGPGHCDDVEGEPDQTSLPDSADTFAWVEESAVP